MRVIFLRKFVKYIAKLIGSGKQGNVIQFGLGFVTLGDSSEFGTSIGEKAVRAKQVPLEKKILKRKKIYRGRVPWF